MWVINPFVIYGCGVFIFVEFWNAQIYKNGKWIKPTLKILGIMRLI